MTSDLVTLDAALRAARALPNAEKLPALERLAGDLRRRCLAGEAAPEALGGRAQALLLSPRLFLARRDGAWRRWARAAARAAAPRLVVSLTSYGRRVATVARVVERMLAQTRPPDLVVLYLARAEFPDEAALPGSLRALLGERFQVRLVEDLKSHKKYFYAFQEFADAAIVTIDDDVLYPADLLARLWASYLRHPYAVTCARAHTICFGQDGAYAPYATWLDAPKRYNRLSMRLVMTGVGSVLYPPPGSISFIPGFFDWGLIERTCPNADDLWLCWNLLENGIPLIQLPFLRRIAYIEGTQEEALCNQNWAAADGAEGGKSRNDAQWEAILAARRPQSELIRRLQAAACRREWARMAALRLVQLARRAAGRTLRALRGRRA